MLPLPRRACASSLRRMRRQRRAQKFSTTMHREVTLSSVITWFLRLSPPRSIHTLLFPKMFSSSARPLQRKHGPLTALCAERPERRATPKWMRRSALGRGAEPRTSRSREREGNSAQEEHCTRRTRIDEAGNQDSITRGNRNLQIADIPAAQPSPTTWTDPR